MTKIMMHHPDTGATVPTTERAFTLAHEKRGWKRVTADTATKDELLAAARTAGVRADPSATKDEIAAAIAGGDDTSSST